ncbi:MAG TPA: VOC family protein [Stellaceae bacterium]|jgi:catechol 2,3-dioxygenase-like lactoylglutathione lyase family enzyme|nr:VOC family protein [Stellaceae bacterium]
MPDDVKFAVQADTAFKITGLDHVVLRVASLERAVRFYGDVLGCPVERELETPRLVQMRAGTSMIDLVPCQEGEEPSLSHMTGRNMDHFAVRIAAMDVPALTAHLARHGIDAGEVRRRYGAEGYGSSIYITDPDGNTVELKGPPETAI